MKKINIILVIITIFLAMITIIGELDKGIVIVLKDLSIILTVTVPYIFRKVFKRNVSEGFIFIWILFIFAAHYLGVAVEGYNKWPGYDKVVHGMSGVLSAYVALEIIKHYKNTNKLFNVLFILSFAWLCAGLWETFEFTCSLLFDVDPQMVAKTGVSDTMWDMISAFLGSIVFSIWYLFSKRSN